MKKINNEIKVILLKAYIVFIGCVLLFWLYVQFNVERGFKPEWEKLSYILFAIYVLLVVVMVYLMGKIDIAPSGVSPIVKPIKVKDYSEFKSIIFQSANNYGFNEPYSLSFEENLESALAFRGEKGSTTVLQTIWMEELNTELLDIATELFWKETQLYVGKDKIQREPIALIQCICVQRINSTFRKLTNQNVPQDYKRYQFFAAISFGGKKAYLCRTKGGFYRGQYRYLKREFEFIAEPIWAESKNN